MRFYRINLNNVVNSRKESYAYLTLNKDNYSSTNRDIYSVDNFIYKCPFCGREKINYFYPEQHIAVFNKNKIGDFSYDVTSYGDITISEKVVEMLTKYKIKGVLDMKEYLFVETKRREKIDLKLFEAKLIYLPNYWKYVIDDRLDDMRSTNIRRKDAAEIECIHCEGIYSCYRLSKKAKVYIDNLKEIDYDIFITMDQASDIIVSERFVEACKKENLTNILDKLVEVYDANDYIGLCQKE